MRQIEKKQNKIIFETEIGESLANAIRRYINHIPTLAVDEVEIIKNGSALYDEVFAHRIGLIPLKMDKAITEKNPGKISLSVKKEGFVVSGEMKGHIEPVYDNIPITFLDKEQEVEFNASVKAGKGVEHVKFSPGLMFYRNSSKIKVNKNLLEEIKRFCPDCNMEEKGENIIIKDDKAKDVLDIIEGIAERNGKEAEIEFGKELVINIESFGQMDVKDIFLKSASLLKKDLETFSGKIK